MPKKTLIITAIIVAVIALGATAVYVTLRQEGGKVKRPEGVVTIPKAPEQPSVSQPEKLEEPQEPVVQPEEKVMPQEPATQPKEPTTAESTESVDTQNWKIYRNQEFGFEMKYPLDWHFGGGEAWEYKGKTVFFITLEYPFRTQPSIRIDIEEVMKEDRDWESLARTKYFPSPDLSLIPSLPFKKIEFKGRPALHSSGSFVEPAWSELIYTEMVAFPTIDDRYLIAIQFYAGKEDKDFTKGIYDKVLESFHFM
jgi:hypothetical protein